MSITRERVTNVWRVLPILNYTAFLAVNHKIQNVSKLFIKILGRNVNRKTGDRKKLLKIYTCDLPLLRTLFDKNKKKCVFNFILTLVLWRISFFLFVS